MQEERGMGEGTINDAKGLKGGWGSECGVFLSCHQRKGFGFELGTRTERKEGTKKRKLLFFAPLDKSSFSPL